MLTLLARSFGRVSRMWAACALLLAGFQVALTSAALSLQESGDYGRLFDAVPAFVRNWLGPSLSSFAGMTALVFFEPLVILLLVLFAVYIASEPASDVEDGLVDLLLADALDRDQLLGAAEVRLGQLGGGARGGELGLGAGDLGLEGPGVDGEERFALLDHLALAEVHLVERAGDAGADLHGVGRFQARGEFIEVLDFARDRRGDRHGRGAAMLLLLILLLSSARIRVRVHQQDGNSGRRKRKRSAACHEEPLFLCERVRPALIDMR